MFAQLLRLPRMVPVTILTTGLLLGLKTVDLGRDLLVPGTAATTVFADAQAAPAPAPPPPKSAPMPAPAQVSLPVVPLPVPEPVISPAERQLLQELRNRHTELDAREHLLQQRETVLDAAEHRLTARIAEMAGLQARLEQLETARREHNDANWTGLVKVYETMKPRDAASIFNDMDMPVLLQVIDRMKDSKAAIIMAAMQPDRARLLTAQLAALRTRSTTVPPPPGG